MTGARGTSFAGSTAETTLEVRAEKEEEEEEGAGRTGSGSVYCGSRVGSTTTSFSFTVEAEEETTEEDLIL